MDLQSSRLASVLMLSQPQSEPKTSTVVTLERRGAMTAQSPSRVRSGRLAGSNLAFTSHALIRRIPSRLPFLPFIPYLVYLDHLFISSDVSIWWCACKRKCYQDPVTRYPYLTPFCVGVSVCCLGFLSVCLSVCLQMHVLDGPPSPLAFPPPTCLRRICVCPLSHRYPTVPQRWPTTTPKTL